MERHSGSAISDKAIISEWPSVSHGQVEMNNQHRVRGERATEEGHRAHGMGGFTPLPEERQTLKIEGSSGLGRLGV